MVRSRHSPVVARTASAGGILPRSTDTTTPAEDATTTATAFNLPTADDQGLLDFAQSIELAATVLYGQAAEALGGEPVVTAQVVDVFGAHHKAYAQSISGLLGRNASNTANASLVDQLTKSFSDAAGVVEAALALEEAAVATHLSLLGQLEGTDASTLIASIVATEARHAAALKAIAGDDPMPSVALATTDDALNPDDLPVEG